MNELVDFGPGFALRVMDIGVILNVGIEHNVILLFAVAELHGLQIKYTILEGNQIWILIDLLDELRVQEQLPTLPHDVGLEGGLFELITQVLPALFLLFCLTLCASTLTSRLACTCIHV